MPFKKAEGKESIRMASDIRSRTLPTDKAAQALVVRKAGIPVRAGGNSVTAVMDIKGQTMHRPEELTHRNWDWPMGRSIPLFYLWLAVQEAWLSSNDSSTIAPLDSFGSLSNLLSVL